MKFNLLFLLWLFSLSLFSQVAIKGPWTIECGASTNTFFKTPASLNLRYISPRFKWSDYELTAEEEKHVGEFMNTRLMLELIYTPPLKVLCMGFNVQSRLLKYKRLSMDVYVGMKFFVVPGPDFGTIPYLKAGREFWYMNMGLIFQIDLGIIKPFADIGGDKIFTVGTELNFKAIYKKTKKRYKLNARPADK